MRLREAERIARQVVPGGGSPRVTAVSASRLQHTFRVDRDRVAFSMRLAAAPERAARSTAMQNGAWLQRVLQAAADHALAPPLIFADAQRGVIVQRWVEGNAWPAAADAVQTIERIAALLRRVHALAVPAPARVASPGWWIRYYTAALSATRCMAPAPALAAAAKKKLSRLKALPQVGGVICHSDLHRLNLLEYRPPRSKAKALLLLDWEYAHVSDPFWDLAGWSVNNDYPTAVVGRLLGSYLGRAPDRGESTRCELLCWLYDYVCLLWSDLYLPSRRVAAASAMAARFALLQARLIAGCE